MDLPTWWIFRFSSQMDWISLLSVHSYFKFKVLVFLRHFPIGGKSDLVLHFAGYRKFRSRSVKLIRLSLYHSATAIICIQLFGPNHHVEIARGRRSHVRCKLVQILGQISSPHWNDHNAIAETLHLEGTWNVAMYIAEFQTGSFHRRSALFQRIVIFFLVSELLTLIQDVFHLQLLNLTFNAYLLLLNFKKWKLWSFEYF